MTYKAGEGRTRRLGRRFELAPVCVPAADDTIAALRILHAGTYWQ
jgi:hypothetical protein